MTLTIRELKMLREVLLTINNITLRTRQTLLDISNHQPTSSSADRDRLKKEIKNLDVSITTTRSLLVFYENRIQEEIERGDVRRHMDDARVLCGAIREMRKEQREQMSQREELCRQERLAAIAEERTPEEKQQQREMDEIAKYKAGYMSKEQVLEVAKRIKECEEAKALRLLKEEKEDDKENLDDEITLVQDGGSEQHGPSSLAMLHRILTSLRRATKKMKSGPVTSSNLFSNGNIELETVEDGSNGSFSRIMRNMSLQARRTSDRF